MLYIELLHVIAGHLRTASTPYPFVSGAILVQVPAAWIEKASSIDELQYELVSGQFGRLIHPRPGMQHLLNISNSPGQTN